MGAHYWYGFSDEGLWEAEWAGEMDLIVDTIGDPDFNPSLYKVMKSGALIQRVNITPCEKPRSERTQFGFGIFGKTIDDKAIDYDAFHSFKEDKELFTKDLAHLLDLHKVGKIRPNRIVSRVGFDKLEGEWESMSMRNYIAVVSPWTNVYRS
jgi:NADPH:quinone reductase-like Zn-dependent oxidoreductase